MQRNHQVAFDTRNSRFRRIFPLQEPVADITSGNKLVTDHDFIAVRIMEISRRSLPAVFVELKANLFIDACFRFQITVAHVIATDAVRRIKRTALTACVQDKVRIGLIQVWCFVRTGNTAFDQPVFADLMREVQSPDSSCCRCRCCGRSGWPESDGFCRSTKYCLQRRQPSCVAKPCRRALRRYR